jgi:hypothetical protein
MNKFLFLAVIAVMPALLSQAFAQDTTRGTGTSPLASESTQQKNTPPARTGGLLNSDATPAQAAQKTRETNHRIAQGKLPAKPAER